MEMLKQADWRRPDSVAPADLDATVRAVIDAVAERGDAAVTEYSRKFDGYEPSIIELQPWEQYPLSDETKAHLRVAAERIQTFAKMQFEMYRDVEREDHYGRFGQTVKALPSMAAYIPGGRFPLVSTALMTLIPARVAGVPRRVAVSPSNEPAILAAASLAGATAFVHMGGAQAIAALALGSQWADPVDMIVGPGNAYVNAAKGLLQGKVKIDTLAGPSEILVLCDDSVDPRWLALDVLAQAEHDPMALSVLATTDEALLQRIAAAVETELAKDPDKDEGVIQLVHCENREQMVALANEMGAEHLHLACREGTIQPDEIDHYGSLFIGGHSAVALGDYCTGPNHTLPTLAVARRKGGLQVGDFLKVLTWQQVKPDRYGELAKTAIHLAQLEGLVFHERSLQVRLPESS
ncbi:histidinol dehydrogenase [Acanthopleuribacter pedis]|uniref:Histidinol dehydrogenase n=1 Tax=Acanthopleuribacter pedis TaxID=442870 RepID=A0A8J7U4X1_9BACT|nr:histidinol dehydrogenase [Acanthopleuribacter pedis]MBO1320234.1 histidinol dehydrogenase [Acanthopleuribacter pedis]